MEGSLIVEAEAVTAATGCRGCRLIECDVATRYWGPGGSGMQAGKKTPSNLHCPRTGSSWPGGCHIGFGHTSIYGPEVNME